ncbi:aminotransferase class I/II-fold pyridoxal phosphate-dependent enzyme [Fibrella forsythiae]|uniref:8-amino-7-oxononanoate synthase n=1 Tax=Fibrella forsythiae TaxID=2817061 RepID=A0ABS3JJ55_9BACT|nr:8-amino-7-oxononanoate synthase [Fibrella forsythiae]MBO0949453.1 8-amino-7-oxononanoate synthase [Fibrella forsythiae]
MPNWLLNRLETDIDNRKQRGLFRSLTVAESAVDFTSNDYLGIGRSGTLHHQLAQASAQLTRNGATGSRLLAGHTYLADTVEADVARFYQAETALIFNAGYMANLGLLACLPQPGDTLITDELIHASLIDGARLSKATRHRFAHNDIVDLEDKLREASKQGGNTFVVVESLYSMDGDEAPLPQIAALCTAFNAALIVDEAHASGVYGPGGAGLVAAHGLQDQVTARVHTFGKALGVHGAAVLGLALLRTYLINTARSFIYATALPPHDLLAIQLAHMLVAAEPERAGLLHERVAYFRKKCHQLAPEAVWLTSTSPIQGLIVPGNSAVRRVAAATQAAGFDVRPIVSPTVAAGQERIRICLHSYNTEAEIDGLVTALTIALQETAMSVGTVTR